MAYKAKITKVSELSTGKMVELVYEISDDTKVWKETANFDDTNSVADIQAYIKKKIAEYETANSLVSNLKKEIDKEITN